MQNIRLLLDYNRCFDTGKFDQLHDLLAPDFFFKNPLFEIRGKNQYIEYASCNYMSFVTNTLSIVKLEVGTYQHKYELILVNSEQKKYETIFIVEINVIRDNQILSSILDYDVDCFSVETKEILKNASVIHIEKPK